MPTLRASPGWIISAGRVTNGPPEVAIMVDRPKQSAASATNLGGWYMMHGGSGPNSKKGWKNELFGDGHAESRRMDQMKEHWAPANPQAW